MFCQPHQRTNVLLVNPHLILEKKKPNIVFCDQGNVLPQAESTLDFVKDLKSSNCGMQRELRSLDVLLACHVI